MDLDDAGFELVDAVYEYGVRRRALDDALRDTGAAGDEADPFHRKLLSADQLRSARELSSRRVIRDWEKIKADYVGRSKHDPPRDEWVFDAET